MKDKLDKNVKILQEDIVYIYEHKNRNNIDSFSDLKKIKVLDILPTTSSQKEIMVAGLDENNEKIIGFVVYKQNGNLIETAEGLKYISYYLEKNEVKLCLKKVKDIKTFYKIKLILSLKEICEFAVDIFPDMLFINEDDIDRFTDTLKVKKAELTSDKINININRDDKSFKDYIIYINGKMLMDPESKRQVFDYIANNKNSKNNTMYNFNKSFSLKAVSYELEEIIIG